MATEAGICNAALQLVKHSKTITSLQQPTKEANACEVVFEELRDTMLEMHVWNFAIRRVQLAALIAAPAFEWDYSYQLPADHLRVVSVNASTAGLGHAAYRIEGSTLSADAEEIYLKYVARITDPNLMTPTFRAALTKLLASRLAVALTQSPALSKELYAQFIDQDLPSAKSADALADQADQLPESDWVAVRYGGRMNQQYNSGIG
jgi:hypothetical protein